MEKIQKMLDGIKRKEGFADKLADRIPGAEPLEKPPVSEEPPETGERGLLGKLKSIVSFISGQMDAESNE